MLNMMVSRIYLNRAAYNSGVTMIELIVVVAMLAILATMAAPSMTRVALDGQATESINTLIASLRSARSEAVVGYKSRVIVCISSNGRTCTGGADWSNGWIVFVDKNSNNTMDGQDTLVRVASAQADALTIRAARGDNNASIARLEFDTEGMLPDISTFTICDKRGSEFARALVINASGQTRIATDDDDNGIVDTHMGNARCSQGS